MLLCAGDTGFNAAKTFDLEVWLPSGGGPIARSARVRTAPISKRAARRFASAATPKAKPELVHTLNGSGLAIGRTLVAISRTTSAPTAACAFPPLCTRTPDSIASNCLHKYAARDRSPQSRQQYRLAAGGGRRRFQRGRGRVFAFLGPTGRGKPPRSTPWWDSASITAGSIAIFGHDVERDWRAARRLVGVAPQEYTFDRYLSIRDVLIYQAGYYGLPRRAVRARADELLERFQLDSKADQLFTKLSGGMKRRLTLARALVHSPRLLVLDEPTAGVDVELRLEIWELVRELNAEGTTILLTTHDSKRRETCAATRHHRGRAHDHRAARRRRYCTIAGAIACASPWIARPTRLSRGISPRREARPKRRRGDEDGGQGSVGHAFFRRDRADRRAHPRRGAAPHELTRRISRP